MSKANPVDRKRLPLGRLLITLGVVGLIAVVAHAVVTITTEGTASLGTIQNQAASTHTLPAASLVFTRPADASDAREASIKIAPITATFTPETTDRFITIDGQRHRFLGTLITANTGPLTIELTTDTYPVNIRRDPLAFAQQTLIRAAALGTAAALLIPTGAFIAIQRRNDQRRQARGS